MQDKFILIDGNSLLFRAFYALPLLTNHQGEYTNAVYGFLTMLRRLVREEQPSHIAVAFDKSRRSFRTQLYPEYKGTRGETPPELVGQFAMVREALQALRIVYLEMDDYEGDDIIGTLSRWADDRELPCLIVTGDRDAFQLISNNTKVLLTRKGISMIEYCDLAFLQEQTGLSPAQMVEQKALMGDNSDNIPGVPGIGEKTAQKLLLQYQTLDGVYEHLPHIRGPKLRDNLSNYKEQAYLSRRLGEIVRNVPLSLQLADMRCQEPDYAELAHFFKRWDFQQFLQGLYGLQPELEKDGAPEEDACQPSSTVNIRTAAELQAFFTSEAAPSEFTFLLETEGDHAMTASGKGIWLAYDGKTACLDDTDGAGCALLQPWWEDEQWGKYTFDAKFAEVFLRRRGFDLVNIQGDLLLLLYVKNPEVAADNCAAALAPYVQGIPVTKLSAQVQCLLPVYRKIYAELPSALTKLLEKMELTVSSILADMEYTGVKVAPDILTDISRELTQVLAYTEKQIYALAEQKFNINSPKQLGTVLFEDLGLPALKKTKTGYSTNAEVLEKLLPEHEIIGHILEYRSLSKLKSTYLDPLPELINHDTGRIHTVFKQAQTATGRLSSVEPNLQNIPIKLEAGRSIRRAFQAEKPDACLLSADYSQIDLRSLAHISRDRQLIDTFARGEDIHTRTASEIFAVPIQDVSEDLRRRAKAVNFGIVYGISDYGLARDTGVSVSEAGQYIREYLQAYPGVSAYMRDIVELGKKQGYVETLFGRRRYLPELKSGNYFQRDAARRMALNTPIQGTSADIIKLAMIKAAQALKAAGLQAKMILQVHDELIFEVKASELAATARLVRDSMENAAELRVPLQVSLNYGRDWYHMQPWNAEDD